MKNEIMLGKKAPGRNETLRYHLPFVNVKAASNKFRAAKKSAPVIIRACEAGRCHLKNMNCSIVFLLLKRAIPNRSSRDKVQSGRYCRVHSA
jgi:hypothetical protein